MTKYHSLGSLKNINLFSTVHVKSKVKMPVDSVSDEDPFPGV